MGNVVQTLFVITFVIHSVHYGTSLLATDCDTHTAPCILLSEDDIELTYGITWNITCIFRHLVVWKPYDPWFDWAPPNITSTAFDTGDKKNPHGANLTIWNTSAAIVGRYYCVPSDRQDDDLDEMVTEDIASSVYVFVKDLAQPLVPTPNTVHYVQKEKTFIPCKPSYPDVEVELCNKFKECLTGYNPEKGFTVSKSLLLSEDGMLSCTSDTASYTMHVVVKIDLPEPNITSATDNFVLEGQLVKLNCSITVLPSQAVKISWKILPQATGTNQSIKEGKLEKTSHPELNNRVVFSRELIISNVTVQDRKTYRCEVFDNQNNTNYDSFKLIVHEKSHNYAKLTGMNNRAVINRKRNSKGELKPIDVFVKDRSYPSNISYSWAKDDALLSESNTDKYHVGQTENSVRLTIIDPTINDTGVYTTVVKSGIGHENFDAYVYVYEKPSVYMESKYAYGVGDEVEFICYVVGYPSPEIRFGFQHCEKVPWQNCSYAEDTRLDEEADVKSSGIMTKRKQKIKGKPPGHVYCTATNSEGSETTQAYLLVRSMTKKIQLERIPADGLITVGDNVTFTCSAIDVNYSNIPTDLRFLHNGKELSQSDRVHQLFFYESIFFKSKLTIMNVSLDTSGEMSCRIKSKDAYDTSTPIQFEVVTPIGPRLLSGKENESIEKSFSENLTLHCDVAGIPQPKVTWFKEGSAIELQNNNSRLYVNESMLTIHSLNQNDFGLYECRAENKADNITKSWSVKQESTLWIWITVIFVICIAAIGCICYLCREKIKNWCNDCTLCSTQTSEPIPSTQELRPLSKTEESNVGA